MDGTGKKFGRNLEGTERNLERTQRKFEGIGTALMARIYDMKRDMEGTVGRYFKKLMSNWKKISG